MPKNPIRHSEWSVVLIFLAIAFAVLFAASAQAQPTLILAQAGSASGSTESEPLPHRSISPNIPTTNPNEGSSVLPWVLSIGVAVVLVVGGIVFFNVAQKRREASSGPKESITPDQGVILKDYRFQRHLMTGQSSQVWEVVEVNSGRSLAMKILLPEKASEAQERQQLFYEADVGEKLAHPNIIRILKVDRSRFNPYFVMEFFPSGSLSLRIQHKEWDYIREFGHSILKQTATALAFMNAKGWVHRDVKPANILVNAAGDVRLIDFALAQRAGGGSLLKKAKAKGTRSYMSPEQILCKPLDGRADIYSFGASAYELVAGRPPFRASDGNELLRKHLSEKPLSPEVHNPQVTREFAELVLLCLAKKREDRPNDFHAVLMKLKNIRLFKGQKAEVTTE